MFPTSVSPVFSLKHINSCRSLEPAYISTAKKSELHIGIRACYQIRLFEINFSASWFKINLIQAHIKCMHAKFLTMVLFAPISHFANSLPVFKKPQAYPLKLDFSIVKYDKTSRSGAAQIKMLVKEYLELAFESSRQAITLEMKNSNTTKPRIHQEKIHTRYT